jgi:site-specific DNA-cytosine methylase
MKELDPTIWVWESVPGAYTGEHDELSQFISKRAIELGYTVYHFLHDSKFFGLPQQRRRVFTIASKVKIYFPVPTAELVTVGEALAEVQDPGEIPSFSYKWQSYLPFVGHGERLRIVVLRSQDPPAPGFLIHRAHPNQVSRTMLGGVHVIHPWEDRFVGVNEAKALCGYPKDYEFDRAGGDYFQQIAKAVTPAAGDYLGVALKWALERNEPTSGEEWEVKLWAKSPRVTDERLLTDIRRLR